MKILVTGATGFLGGALVRRLLEERPDVRCLVRATSNRGRLDALAKQFLHRRLDIFEGDLDSTGSAAAALEGVDLVFHVAAGMKGSADDLWRDSVTASEHLLAAIERLAPSAMPAVVLISSIAVHALSDLPRGWLVDERTTIEPRPERRDPYVRAKVAQEQLFREWQSRLGFPLTIVRPGVIYGPGSQLLVARLGIAAGPLFLAIGGDNTLPLTYIDNCADAIVYVSNRPQAVGETFDLVDDDLPTCRAFLRRYRGQHGSLRVVPAPYRLILWLGRARARRRAQWPRLLGWVPSADRIVSLWAGHHFSNAKLVSLGWTPPVRTEEGLRRAFSSLAAPSSPHSSPRKSP